MANETVVTIKYRALQNKDTFFEHGRPLVDPKRPRLYLSRRFDFLLILSLFLSLIAVLVHGLLVAANLPKDRIATANVTSQCAILEGEWNRQHNILRFWSVPYAAPPVIKSQLNYEEVWRDLAEKHKFYDGGLRWHKPYSVNDTEYCFLSFDDRCNYVASQWYCKMRRPNRTSTCVELGYDGKLLSETTENCLTLDIAAPAFTGDLFPVIVVLSGFRSLHSPIASKIARESAYLPTDSAVLHFGAVWVNVHNRLGPLGAFYNFAQLDRPGNNKTEFVNFALHDQRAALQWIQQNIGRYGGDASRVVLLAHDSGATSALQLLHLQAQQQDSHPWFQAVWIASGSTNWYHSKNKQWQELQAYTILRSLKECPTADAMELNSTVCLRNLHEKYTDMELTNLLEHFRDAYKHETWVQFLLNPVRYVIQNVPVSYAVDKEFQQGPPPIDWTIEIIQKIFYASAC